MTHLQLFTLGSLGATLDGQPVRWRSSAAEELLHYLLAHPEGRTRAELFEDLWQTDPNPHSANRFRVTLYRLRRALARPDAVREQHGRLVLSDEVWQASDVSRLHAALREGEQAQDPEVRLLAYGRLRELYRGDFLAGREEDWALRAREEQREAYVRGCLGLAALHCARGECAASVEARACALRADPYLGEQHHQILMGCLSVAESPYGAVEHFRRFARFLRDELNDAPMPETAALVGRIKGGAHVCARLEGTLSGQTVQGPLLQLDAYPSA